MIKHRMPAGDDPASPDAVRLMRSLDQASGHPAPTAEPLANPQVASGSGMVTGVLFDDRDHDGRQDKGEQTEAGWRVFLDANNNGRLDYGERSTVSDAAGRYGFDQVTPGSYHVVVQAPFGWQHWSFGDGSAAPPAGDPADGLTPVERLKAAAAVSQAAMAAAGHAYFAADFTMPHVAGQLVVKLAGAEMAPAATEALMHSVGASLVQSTVALGVQLWSIHGMSIEQAAAKLTASGEVAYANPNYIAHADDAPTVTPNDPRYTLEYGMPQVDAPAAWAYGTGSAKVVVADIDSGMDMTHPDLVHNLWTNPGEIPGNGIDDDGDGYIDDVHGWDFVNDDNDPSDDYFHGTHTAGTIGAEGNNAQGVAGVDWAVSLMPLKFIDSNNHGTSFDATRALEYATMMGVRVTNNSWGGVGPDNGLYDAIAASGLFVAAAGNNHSDNDARPFFPATFDLPNIISVAAVNANRDLAEFSDYGAKTVDLAAPGVHVMSTYPVSMGSYAFLDGTSMATPHVTGAAALLMALDPSLSLAEIKTALLDGATPLASLQGKVLTGGELDILGALDTLSEGSQLVAVAAGHTSVVNFAAHSAATAGRDVLAGFDLAERIDGLGGDDVIKAGAGDDVLIGGRGADQLWGGAGADVFYFAKASGADVIRDFSRTEGDQVRIDVAGVARFSDLVLAADGHGGTLVTFGSSSIDFAGVKPSQLGARDFAFGPLAAQAHEPPVLSAGSAFHEAAHLHLALV